MENYYVTHCCKNKDEREELMPAIKRYLGSYISDIYKIAKNINEKFLIFSGKYGFLEPDELIPYYDKLLSYEDFDNLLKITEEQYKKYNFKKITFMHIDTSLDAKVKVYVDFIKKFSELHNIELKLIPIKPDKIIIPKSIENKYYYQQIKKLKKEKKFFIASNIYMKEKIQNISDFIGGPYEIIKEVRKSDYKICIICGVTYLSELVAIFNPRKIIIQPRLDAICRFNNILDERDVLDLRKVFPDSIIFAHISCNLKVKLLADWITDEKHLIEYLQQNKITKNPIILLGGNFCGDYISNFTDKEIICSEGYCVSSIKFTDNVINDFLKKKMIKRKEIKILVTPQCHFSTFKIADEVLNPYEIYNYVRNSNEKKFLICSEINFVMKLKKEFPEKEIYSPIENAVCNDINRIRLKDVYEALINLRYKVKIPEEISEKIREKVIGLNYGS